MPYNTLALETSRLDTLLAFLAVAISFADYSKHGLLRAARVYPYVRREGDTKSLQRYKWHAFIYVVPEVYDEVTEVDTIIVDEYADDIDLLAAFTAGLIDSDGTIVMSFKRRRGKMYFETELEIVNANKDLLTRIQQAWADYGIVLGLHVHSKIGKTKRFKRLRPVWRLRTCSQDTISKMLEYILPYMYNIKRIARATLTKRYINGKVTKNTEIFRRVHERLIEYYDHVLKEKSIQLIQKLYWNDEILAIEPNGTIKVTPRALSWLINNNH
ncbi:hypothetical protein DRO31_06405 [Candidatus Bathyarchaeota archaeon]|nr:MAG: hypothetical protein DRO31_06405 [Candidatus Bathyarchaeota archaeon]